jgi:hypothetical protein
VSATTALLRGRHAAQALMLDTVVVTRLNAGATTTDPETGQITPTYTTVYTGPGKVQVPLRATIARPATVGEAERFLARLEVHLPVTVTGVTSDDIVTVTASALDPDLVGKVFHVREVSHKSWLTARRFGVEEVTS